MARYFRLSFALGILIALSLRAADSGAVAARPFFKDFMGINGHTVQFRPQLYQPVASLVRDYHPVEWDLGKDSDFEKPFPRARNGVDWKSVYGSWKKFGWQIDVSCMFETLPRARWKDLAVDSRRYAERMARSLGPSGANALVDSVEIGNEPGKYSDSDYRIVFENMARGFKAGDPRIRVATGAMTTGKSHDYAKSVACISGLENLYDVLNVHSYAQLEGWPTWRRSFPEDPRLTDYLPDIARLCQWRDEHAPGKEVWLTEFGYDATTRTPNPNNEFKKWVGVTEEQQAQWLVRSWLNFASMPIQRAYLYFFNDDDTPQVHGSSGLTRNFQPKPAFFAVGHLRRTLGDFRFGRTVIDRPGDALIYEFNHGSDPKRKIWVAWSPTGTGRKSTLQLPDFHGVVEKAERMPLSSGDDVAVSLPPRPRDLEIGEAPLYLFLKDE